MYRGDCQGPLNINEISDNTITANTGKVLDGGVIFAADVGEIDVGDIQDNGIINAEVGLQFISEDNGATMTVDSINNNDIVGAETSIYVAETAGNFSMTISEIVSNRLSNTNPEAAIYMAAESSTTINISDAFHSNVFDPAKGAKMVFEVNGGGAITINIGQPGQGDGQAGLEAANNHVAVQGDPITINND